MSYRYGASYRDRPRDGNRDGGYADNGYGAGSYNRRNQPEDYDPYGEDYGSGNDRFNSPPPQSSARAPPFARNAPARVQRTQETSATRQISEVLEHIKSEWPSMCDNECIPVQMALQLLDTSSVGRAHEYRKFQQSYNYLQESLKNIVHEHHQGFNSSIGTFHKIQGSIQASQKRVRALKESLAASKTSLCTTDPELKKLYKSSQMYDGLLQTLSELEELRVVPDQLEARISEKRFLNAVDVLQTALRKLRKPELDELGALADLRGYLENQETALMDILVEELHEHLYLKSPYCQERWQNLAKNQGAFHDRYDDSNAVAPFLEILEGMDFERPLTEDPAKNPEADTFYYVELVVEALNKLGRLEGAVDMLKQRLPVELFAIVNETVNEVDQRHPSSMRGGSSNSQGIHMYGNRETQMRADVIYDLLWTLYGKFEAIAEGHRVFHEAIKALIRREGAGNNTALLGTFKELWNLYQNEIRSLLHNYVTTDADVYQYSSTPRTGATGSGIGGKRDNLFKFSEADPKSPAMTTEYEALDEIIEAAVPGLASDSRKLQSGDAKKGSSAGRSALDGSRRAALAGAYNQQNTGSHKSLVEPSVFNMSLLLPPTLVFLQRLKNIVPPGSDLAASTLTSFLDNFLVNVFQPQLDETLGKLSDTIFGEADSFLQDANWNLVAKKPVLKGSTTFFTIITAFCKMLGTIPHDQALSTLILNQMNRYYERCMNWFKSLVSKAQETSADAQVLRYSAKLAMESGEVNEIMTKLWKSENLDVELLGKEIDILISKSNATLVDKGDIIQDNDTIASLCLLYTSMKWLSAKVSSLRHITQNETDSNRHSKPISKRWTLLNDPKKITSDQGLIFLPMTQETVQSFDSIVTSYEELACMVLLTVHAEMRCRIIQSLHAALSPDSSAPYLLEQEVQEPDPEIILLNNSLVNYDETVARHLRDREVAFVRTGLGLLVGTYLTKNALMVSPMNEKGCGRMLLNILVLQQNLKNIEPGVDLKRAADYFELFKQGPDAIVEAAKTGADGAAQEIQKRNQFSYDELKGLVELCYSEQTSNPERGIATAAKRQMADRLLNLSEYMWQS